MHREAQQCDRYPVLLTRLLQTARQEIDRHVNDRSKCAACGFDYPCERAVLAELALSAM